MKNTRNYIVTITVVSAFVLSGCTIDAVHLNRQAQSQIKQGNLDKASELLKRSHKADYYNSPSHYWLGYCYKAQGQMTRALWEYELAVRFDPSFDKAQLALIETLNQAGQKDKSLEKTSDYLKYKKDEPMSFFQRLGGSFLQNQMDDHAILTYQLASQCQPKNAVPLAALADYYFDRGAKEKGVEYLTRAFQADPIYPGLARRLGELGYKVEFPEESEGPAKPGSLESTFEGEDK